MKKLLLGMFLCGILLIGQNSSFIQLQTGPPAGVTTVNVSANSLGGGMTYYYFVIATYPAGKVVSQGKQISNIAVPSVGSPVTITWGLDAAAISYDVIRLTSQNYNTSCTSCAVVTGTTLGTVNDTGTLSNYTLTGAANTVQGSIILNNRDYSEPTFTADRNVDFRSGVSVSGSMIAANLGNSANLLGRPVIAGNRVLGTTGSGYLVYSSSPTVIAGVYQAASIVPPTTFVGTGLNDATYNGIYTGFATTTYCVIITGTGSPNQFKWGTNVACDNGGTGVNITGSEITLSSAITISFNSTIGHTMGDKWSSTFNVSNPATFLDATGNKIGEIRNDGIWVIRPPVSCTGLATGTLYNNSGVAAFCP